MTDDDIRAIEERAAKAVRRGFVHAAMCGHYLCDDCPCGGEEGCNATRCEGMATAPGCDCYAAPEQVCRTDVPALCRELRETRARVAELEAALREAAHAVASAAEVIEGLDGDMDDECKGAREDVGTWLKLAGAAP